MPGAFMKTAKKIYGSAPTMADLIYLTPKTILLFNSRMLKLTPLRSAATKFILFLKTDPAGSGLGQTEAGWIFLIRIKNLLIFKRMKEQTASAATPWSEFKRTRPGTFG